MLDLNTIRRDFARDLSADPLRFGLDRALAAAIQRAYQQGLADAGQAAAHLWRQSDDVPPPSTTAIIATLSDDGEFWALLDGIYRHTGSEWREEQSGAPLDYAEYWWIDETALTTALPLPRPDGRAEVAA